MVKKRKFPLPNVDLPKELDFEVGKYKGKVKCTKKKCSINARKKGFLEDLF